jgi:predicted tellurium resistance membrane protein TerC
MTELLTLESLIALVTLTSLEVILGIDNIVVITIIVSRLPLESRDRVRKIGLIGAMVSRIALLFFISHIMALTTPLFEMFGVVITGKSLVLIFGGLFLIGKATVEIQHSMELKEETKKIRATKSILGAIAQIIVIDIVFSIDSVITAVGMVQHIPIMVMAVVLSVLIMLVSAKPIGEFIEEHPTFKILALSFLVLIGSILVLDGVGTHIDKGYIYFAMGYSAAVSAINLRISKRLGKN